MPTIWRDDSTKHNSRSHCNSHDTGTVFTASAYGSTKHRKFFKVILNYTDKFLYLL